MALIENLKLKIEANGAQAIATFKGLESSAAGLSKGLGTAGGTATGALGKISGAVSKASGGLVNIGENGLSMGAMVSAGSAVAGLAMIKFAANGVGSMLKLAEATKNLQRATGATAEQASGLIAIGDDFNVSAQTITGAMAKMAVTIGKNGEALDKFGVSTARSKNGNVDIVATLENIADAYAATTDPAQRAALMQAAFGKGWKDMIPLVEGGRQAIAAAYAEAGKTHQILSEKDVQKAEDLRLGIDNLGDAFGGFERELGSAVIPSLTSLTGALTGVLAAVDKLHVLDLLNPFRGFNSTSGVSADGLDKMTHAADYTGKIVFNSKSKVDAATASVDGLGDAATSTGTDLATLGETTAKMTGPFLAIANAQHASEAAARGVTDANRALGDAQTALSAKLAKGAVDAKAVAQAQDTYNASLNEVNMATGKLADAQAQLARDMKPATFDEMTSATDRLKSSLLDLSDAQQKLTDDTAEYEKLKAAFDSGSKIDPASAVDIVVAGDDYNDALKERAALDRNRKTTQGDRDRADQKVARALKTLNDLQSQGTVTEKQVADARRQTERDTISVDGATTAYHDAESGLNVAKQVGSELDPTIIADRQTIAALTGDLGTKTLAAGTAEAAWNVAKLGDPDFARDVVGLRRDIAAKTQAVADAQWNVGQTAIAQAQATDTLNAAISNGDTNRADMLKWVQDLEARSPGAKSGLDGIIGSINGLNGLAAPNVFGPGTLGATLGGGFLGGGLFGNVLKHAKGGVTNGASIGEIGEAGPEAIIPLDRFPDLMGGGGQRPLVINVNGALDPMAVAKQIDQLLTRYNKTGRGSYLN